MTTLIRFVQCLRPYLPFMALAFLGALGETASDLLQPWPIKVLFDNVIAGKPLPPMLRDVVAAIFGESAAAVLYFALSAVLAIALLNGASAFMQDFFMPRVGQWVLHDLRLQL